MCGRYIRDQIDAQTEDWAVCLLSEWSGRRTYRSRSCVSVIYSDVSVMAVIRQTYIQKTELYVWYRSYQADVHTEDGALWLLSERWGRRTDRRRNCVSVMAVIRQTYIQKTELCVCYRSDQADVQTEDGAVCLLSEWSGKRTERRQSFVAFIGVIRQAYRQKTELCVCYQIDQADVQKEDEHYWQWSESHLNKTPYMYLYLCCCLCSRERDI